MTNTSIDTKALEAGIDFVCASPEEQRETVRENADQILHQVDALVDAIGAMEEWEPQLADLAAKVRNTVGDLITELDTAPPADEDEEDGED